MSQRNVIEKSLPLKKNVSSPKALKHTPLKALEQDNFFLSNNGPNQAALLHSDRLEKKKHGKAIYNQFGKRLNCRFSGGEIFFAKKESLSLLARRTQCLQ